MTQKNFDIRDYVDFNNKGRAQCPSCLLEGKTGHNLSVLESGAYKCFRSCTPDQIRDALGAKRDTLVPVSTVPDPPKQILISPQKVEEAKERLLNNSTHALQWLNNRGINAEMIQHFRLGVVRAKVGDRSKPNGYSHLPAIAIPLPNHDKTAYFHKKRVRPWVPKEEQPDGYQPWSQYGIPAMVYTTYAPPGEVKETWLCEGEWDAIVLGWAVRKSARQNDVQVSCFTCGAGNIPGDDELAKLQGKVITLFDRDEAGEKGAAKVQGKLKGRCAIATVPAPPDAPKGWDVSDAIAAGMFDAIVSATAEAQAWAETQRPNSLRDRLVINDEMLRRAPDYTDWLVDDILTADELFLLAASPRAGKSLLALTLTHAVATGGKFLGRPVAQGAVIYVRCEDSESKTKERELKQGWGEGLPVYWLDKFKLSELDELEELVEELNVRLIVFDTLSRIRNAEVSESSAEMSQQLEPLQELCKRHRCCGLLVHHTGKVSTDNAGTINVFDTIRGSSAIRATCRGSLILAADERNYRLYVENGWGKLDLQVLLDAHTLNWKLLGNWVAPNVDLSQKDRVLNYLTQVGRANIEEIAEGTQLPKRSLYEVLKRLQSDEIIEKHGDRRSAVYVRSAIQQIQQLNELLNSQDVDGESILTSIQQLPESASSPPKSVQFEKSVQKNDHFSSDEVPPTPGESVELEPESLSDKAFGIQQQFNTNSTRISENPKNPDRGSDSAIQQTDQGKAEVWLFHTELETVVKVVKPGVRKTLIQIPGVGERYVSTRLLKAVEE